MPSTSAASRNAAELGLQIAAGTAHVAISGYASPEVERAYGRARELCRHMGSSTELASVLFGLFVYYVVVPSFRTSLELFDEMLAIADHEKNKTLRIQGLLMQVAARDHASAPRRSRLLSRTPRKGSLRTPTLPRATAPRASQLRVRACFTDYHELKNACKNP